MQNKASSSTEEKNEKSPSYFTNRIVTEIIALKSYAKEIAENNFFYDTQSKQTDKITKALIEFILALPKLKTNKSAMGRYKYQGLPAMLDDINPVLSKFDLKAMQPPHTVGDTTYIVTKILHTSSQYFRCVTSIPKEYIMAGKIVRTYQSLHAIGGAQTYIKRHALKSMLGIDADEDTDGGATIQPRSR